MPWIRVPIEAPPTVLTEDGALRCYCALGGGEKHWHRVTLEELLRMTEPTHEVVWRP